MDVRIGILKKGDRVINVFPYGETVAVSVQRKNGEVDIVFLENDVTDQLMRVGKKITICEGDDMVVLKEGDLTMRKF
jgi:hypothetical protein